MNQQTWIKGMQLSLRAAVGASRSLAVAYLFGLEYPLYAFIAAVIVTDLVPSQTRQLGLKRIVATVVGAVCGAVLGPLLPPDPWAIGLGVLAAMLLSPATFAVSCCSTTAPSLGLMRFIALSRRCWASSWRY